MTPERIQELRELAEVVQHGGFGRALQLAKAIPELLDELDSHRRVYVRQPSASLGERLMVCENCDSLAALVVRLREAALETIRREKHRNDDKCQVCGEPYYSTRCTSSHHPTYPLAALMYGTEAAATAWLEAYRRAVVKERTDELARTIDVLFEYLENDPNYKVTHCAHCEQAYRGRHPTCIVERTGANDREQQLIGARKFWQDYRSRTDAKVEAGLGLSSHWDAAHEVLEAMKREDTPGSKPPPPAPPDHPMHTQL